MRKFILGIMFAACCTVAGLSGASAAPLGSGVSGVTAPQSAIQQVSDYCSYLRYKCNHKGSLGERGEGNCRRYKQECGHVSYCERLRRACVYKEERGRVGYGDCRRYHDQCG